jgi:general secretion pathway protein G
MSRSWRRFLVTGGPIRMAVPLEYSAQPVAARTSPLVWILGTLCVVVLLMLWPRLTSKSGQRPAAQSDVAAIGVELDTFKADVGRYPTGVEGLAALVTPPAGAADWAGPYLKRPPIDPWGRPYAYAPPRGSSPPRVVSAGSDGVWGTCDDILSR